MSSLPRIAALPQGPFARLAALLDGIQPGKPPISLALGDPSGTVPQFVQDALDASVDSFGNYPAIAGTPDWRQAAADWLNRRFALDGAIDPDTNVLPLNGTREGLFLALPPFLPETKAGARPIVAMPNPFYQVYAAAGLVAGAELLYLPACKNWGFLPNFRELPEATLERLAAVYICSPSNPEGGVADEPYWFELFRLAEKYDFIVLADECYADIYYTHKILGNIVPVSPMGALEASNIGWDGFPRLLSFHSLSKRSGLPGLRSGMVAGDADLIARLRAFRNVAGPQVPGPILAASAALWRDEAHVEANRAAYQARMDAAEQILGNRMRRPDGGFFLWLDVGNGEDFALRLWREYGVKVLPGAYMGRDTEPGKSQSNPGFSYVRIALVSDLVTIKAALERVAELLGRT